MAKKNIDEIAKATIQRYNADAKGLRVIRRIRSHYAGAMVVLVEFHVEHADGHKEELEWPVIVRGNDGVAYYDWEHAMADATQRRWFFDFFAADVVLAAMSIGILFASVGLFFGTQDKTIPPAFATALTTVLGFWFGKVSNKSRK